MLGTAVEQGVVTGPASVSVFWSPCPATSEKRNLAVRGTAAVVPGRLTSTDEAYELVDALRKTMASRGKQPENTLHSHFRGTNTVRLWSQNKQPAVAEAFVPVLDDYGHDDGALVVDTRYLCIDAARSFEEDERAVRALVEQAATAVAGSPASPAIRKSCQANTDRHSWHSTATRPVTGELSAAITASLAALTPRDGWALAARVDTSGAVWWSGKHNPAVYVRVEAAKEAAAMTVSATTGCWPGPSVR